VREIEGYSFSSIGAVVCTDGDIQRIGTTAFPCLDHRNRTVLGSVSASPEKDCKLGEKKN
jgi:hypothetical protein